MMDLLSGFPSYSIEHIKREQNKKADALSKLASMTFSKLAKEVLVKVIQNKSITKKGVADIVKEKGDNWMTPIREYLRLGTLADDPQKVRKLRIKAPLYKMIEEKLMHSGPRSVVSKITRLEYYWPSMYKDAKELIQKCKACQIYSSVPRKPKQEMTSIMAAWPFSQWGIDIVGPLPTAPGGARFLVVAIDYFTKWVEAKPLISTTGKHMEKFVWEHIVCRFGRPQAIISDNGKQFVEGTFPIFCKKLGTLQASMSVYTPRKKWTGPYMIRKAYRDGAYKLETLSGEAVDRTWNGTNLYKGLERDPDRVGRSDGGFFDNSCSREVI
ncbi:reverse transcriptase domain-containing protein [Tanacetum coccineum]